ncbi:hypothetical protein LO771_28885 [Streptacidiphilus sp. ASG 303]|uniref:EF-Tu/IF-2/RF-3 family GTPase n=1 Tax=Streptacidiphilus sp. ASG 303 TaxID=2896847 RepID=UPI001E336636|nr:EF-Tu/IF-2/RF-3 family GTPase [Streptacidiphilus sp. ASG 303]MCD0486289.1 hypothetical protein [Streptacidiphilus sp. ASG 303]
MHVEDVFRLNQGRAVMPVGRIERGCVRTGDQVEIIGFGGGAVVPVGAVEVCRRRTDEARAGMNVGLLLPGTAASAVERGQVLAAPGSVSEHVGFAADITLLSDEEGGADVHTGDRLQFHLRAAVVMGHVALSQGGDTLPPLHMGAVVVTLERPVALEEGQPFVFRHHGRAAGSGVVTRLLN